VSKDEDRRIEEIGRLVREHEEKEYADLLRPLDKSERSALADGVFAALDSAEAPKTVEETPAIKEPARVVSIKEAKPRTSRFRANTVLALLAAAFGAAFIFTAVRKDTPQPIAAYSLAVEGGNQAQRGDPPSSPDSVLKLDPASRLSLALRPQTPVSGAIAVRGFLVRDGVVRNWDAPVLLGSGGVVRVEGTAGALFNDLPEGNWDVVLVLGRPEGMPSDEDLQKAAVMGQSLDGLSTHRIKITFSRPRGALDRDKKKEIGFSGCSGLRIGYECELGSNRTLTFFVPAVSLTSIDLRVDGSPVDPTGEATAGGVRISLKVPETARLVQVKPTTNDSAPLALNIVAAEDIPEALKQAETARQRGELEAASKLLEPYLAPGPAAAQRRALQQKARIALATRGHFDDAAQLFRQAIMADRAAGRISDELEDTFALAYGLLLEKRAFSEVRELLDGVGPLVATYPEGATKAAYYRGLLAMETGNLRAALEAFSTAALGAQQLGLDTYRSAVLEQEAEVFAVLGRHDEAAQRHGQARLAAGSAANVCRKAQLASNAGWITLRALVSSGQGKDEAKQALDEGLALTREGCSAGLGNALVNMALLKLELGRGREAREHLDEARKAGGWAEVGGWTQMLEARIWLAEGQSDKALAAYDSLRAEGERLLLPELVYEGSVGRAEVLAAQGKRSEAGQAFAEAAQSLAVWSRGVPVGEGRGTFFSARQRGARTAVDFWLREAERGDQQAARQAVAVARQSLVGFVRAFQWVDQVEGLAPEARKRWDEAVGAYRQERATLEEKAAARGPGAGSLEMERAALRSALDRALAELGSKNQKGDSASTNLAALPGPDEAFVVVHSVLDAQAGLLVKEGGAVEVRRLITLPPDAPANRIAEAWLSPFQLGLEKVRRVRLILPADIAKTDWHALPFKGAPLIEHAEVEYSLDLGARPSSVNTGKVALVIADPTEDLPGARASTNSVVSALEARGLQVKTLVGQAATHEAVRDALEDPSVRFLHYAGHASFDGPDGLEASLRLARRGRFSVADIMALQHVPAVVVLAGCDTARIATGEAVGHGLGLAQAFVLKGSRAAVASPRPLGDTFAQEATKRLYAEPIEREPSVAFRAAVRALRQAAPEGEWASLRLLVE